MSVNGGEPAPQRFAVALMGEDRPGIVADVTGALLRLQCNVEDVATSILRGHFAMMLVFTGGAGLDTATIEAALEPLAQGSQLMFSVWSIAGNIESAQATHVLTVYGRDRAGIVNAVAQTLARLEVNICDMVCRLHDTPEPVYVFTLEIQLPEGVTEEEVKGAVAAATEPLGFSTSLHSVEQSEL